MSGHHKASGIRISRPSSEWHLFIISVLCKHQESREKAPPCGWKLARLWWFTLIKSYALSIIIQWQPSVVPLLEKWGTSQTNYMENKDRDCLVYSNKSHIKASTFLHQGDQLKVTNLISHRTKPQLMGHYIYKMIDPSKKSKLQFVHHLHLTKKKKNALYWKKLQNKLNTVLLRLVLQHVKDVIKHYIKYLCQACNNAPTIHPSPNLSMILL